MTPLQVAAPATDVKLVRMTRLYLMFLFMWQGIFRVSDVGMNTLLIFMVTFLKVLSAVFQLPLHAFVQHLPQTAAGARRYLRGNVDNFIKYVSCPKCHSIFHIESCKVVLPNRTVISGTCSHILFPHHPQRIRRQPCNTVLMKTVRTSAGTSTLYPRQMFCYRSVIDTH